MFEGIKEEISKDYTLKDIVNNTDLKYTDLIGSFPDEIKNKEKTKFAENTKEVDFYTLWSIRPWLYEYIATKIEENFNSTAEFINYLKNNDINYLNDTKSIKNLIEESSEKLECTNFNVEAAAFFDKDSRILKQTVNNLFWESADVVKGDYLVYNATTDTDTTISVLCEVIDTKEDIVGGLRGRILQLKNVKFDILTDINDKIIENDQILSRKLILPQDENKLEGIYKQKPQI